MFSSESITAILDKLSSPRIAASAALASFILLLGSIALFIILKLDEFAQINPKSGVEAIQAIVFLVKSSGSSNTLTAISIFSITFVVSCCALVVELLRVMKESLIELNKELGKLIKRLERSYRSRSIKGQLSEREKLLLNALKVFIPLHRIILIFSDLIFYSALICLVVGLILVLKTIYGGAFLLHPLPWR